MRASGLMMLLALALTGPAMAADVSPLGGHWRLVSAAAYLPGKPAQDSFGPHPSGSLIYTPEGRVSVVISYDGRPRLSGGRSSAPVEERAQAFATSFAYAGTYELKGDTVIHHVEVSSYANWVGTDLVRTFVLDHDRLMLRIAPRLVGGQMQSDELVWQRTR